jgi:cytochrome c553
MPAIEARSDGRRIMKRGWSKALLVLILLSPVAATAQEYTKAGELILPKDYLHWTFLTSGIGMSYPEEGVPTQTTFGNLFVNPKAEVEFIKTGVWPDGTILILEVRDAANRPALNKDARFQSDLLGFEAHVKDSRRGGWVFYAIRKGAQSGKAFPKTATCYSCHEKNGAVDTTFVQYYPTLIEAAKRKGTYKNTGE